MICGVYLLVARKVRDVLNQHGCQQLLDVDEVGDIVCRDVAMNRCRMCQCLYCDEHFNDLMGLCDADSEVEAVELQA